jgi:cob(I)alamin adenosyltransferase
MMAVASSPMRGRDTSPRRTLFLPRITRVYTRSGDDGTTGLGAGPRVPKDSPRVETYGTIDELNSALGVALATGLCAEIIPEACRIQNELFHLGSDLCVPESEKARTPVPVIEARHVEALEKLIDRLSGEFPPLINFVLPGGSPGAAQLHLTRCICRRAERLAVTLARAEPIGPHVIHYLNRLSDALFVMARYENWKRGVPDITWDSHT